jgi:hypothetical protein
VSIHEFSGQWAPANGISVTIKCKKCGAEHAAFAWIRDGADPLVVSEGLIARLIETAKDEECAL